MELMRRLHGWSTGPTTQMSEMIPGVQPVEPGYRRWRIRPRLGDLRWARGQVPTAFGPIRVRWSQNRHGRLRGVVRAPAGTRGQVVLPGRRPIVVAPGSRSRAISVEEAS
jgi:alpha-L-rhamnosidase